MSDASQNEESTVTNAGVKPRGRRRFLGVGVGATPGLMLLASQPALGVTCFTPSRSLSRNMSVSQAGKYGDCTGLSTDSYKTSSIAATTTAFHPTFAGTIFMAPKKVGGGTRSLTMREVLNLPTVPADVVSVPSINTVAHRLVGAYLNVQNGKVPAVVMTSAGVATIWAEFNSRGYYEPMAGTKWYANEIIAYLANSGIAPA